MRVTWADLCVRDGRWRGYTTLAARVYCSRISAEQDWSGAFVIHVQSVEHRDGGGVVDGDDVKCSQDSPRPLASTSSFAQVFQAALRLT